MPVLLADHNAARLAEPRLLLGTDQTAERGRALTPAKGRYCPQCGEGYRAGSRRCEDCGGRIEEETAEGARSYGVRGCTHCGVFLDERGL